MQCEEPATSLVNALVDEVSREELRRDSHAFVVAVNKSLAILLCAARHLTLKRIVELCVRHRTRVEPNVDEVALAVHRLTLVVNEYDIVYIRTVEVYAVVVLLRVVARYEAFVLKRVRRHNTGSHSLLYFSIKLFERTDALLAALVVAPDRKRSTPEA